MGGHSHWATTKHKKALVDAKRGKAFTKTIREITTAARIGGGDPDGNPRLRTAMLKAREQNMPQDNIKKAIQRGTGELPGVVYEEMVYECYGPGGVAMLIEIMTDNKNRTASEVRHILTKYGGSMSGSGTVAWIFSRKGYITVEKAKADEEKLMTLALDAGAEDMKIEERYFEILTVSSDLEKVKKAVEQNRIPMAVAEVTMVPQNYVRLQGRDAEQMLKLMEELEDHEDVQNVYANFDIPDEVIEKIAAR
jgi:YebC/PmpR family DNA-binding regulatory protein